jgi:hypothetical protein
VHPQLNEIVALEELFMEVLNDVRGCDDFYVDVGVVFGAEGRVVGDDPAVVELLYLAVRASDMYFDEAAVVPTPVDREATVRDGGVFAERLWVPAGMQ